MLRAKEMQYHHPHHWHKNIHVAKWKRRFKMNQIRQQEEAGERKLEVTQVAFENDKMSIY